MKSFFTILAFFLGLLAASMILGQTTTQAADDAKVTINTDAEESTINLDQIFPVAKAAQSQPPADNDNSRFVHETHKDWQIRCDQDQDDTICALYQLLLDEENNGVAEFNLIALPKNSTAAAGVTFVTPLQSLLTAGITMKVDVRKARVYPYVWCEQAGCISRFGLSTAEIKELKNGAKATMTIASISRPDMPISLILSLSGFTAAWDSLQDINTSKK